MAPLGVYPESHLDSKGGGIAFGRRKAWLPPSPPALFKFCGDAFAAQVSAHLLLCPFGCVKQWTLSAFIALISWRVWDKVVSLWKCHSLGSWGQEKVWLSPSPCHWALYSQYTHHKRGSGATGPGGASGM